MTQKTMALGVNVLTPAKHKIAGPNGEWWNINQLIRNLTKSFGGIDEHLEALKGRVLETKKGALKRLLEACDSGKQGASMLSTLKMDLSKVGSKVVLGEPKNFRIKKINKLEDLLIKVTGHEKCVKKAISCAKEKRCIRYQKQILSLLKPFGGTEIRMNTVHRDRLKKYGLDVLTDKVKAHTMMKYGSINSMRKTDFIELRVKNAPEYYNRDCGDHAEILAGMRFEAGNVYNGLNNISGKSAKKNAEIPVTLRDTHFAAVIAKSEAITQQEWRNLIVVFFSNVKLKAFQMTTMYEGYYKDATHAPVGNYGTGKKKDKEK